MQNAGHHHLHARKRLYTRLEPFPSADAFKRWFDYLMYIVAIGGPLAMVPQVIQLFTSKDAIGLSLLTWGMWLLFSGMWFIYGIIHKEVPMMISQGLYIVLHVILISGIFMYS